MSASDHGGTTITDKGITIPDVATIRQIRAADLRAIWGQDLDVSPYTPQGQIIDTDAAIIDDKNAQLLYVLNQIDPEKNEGVWQEGVCKIYFITRKPATPTRVICQIVGLAGTLIPAGSMVQDDEQNLYKTESDYIIIGDSPNDLEFICTVPGPVECAAGSVNRIFTQLPGAGWDSVSNAEPGVVGSNAESRKALEIRRYMDVAKNGHGNVDAVRGSIADLDGVLSCAVVDNEKGYARTINGVLLGSHSIFISVYGGADSAIARTIYERLDSCCDREGNNEVVISVPTRDSTKPVHITFNRPNVVQAQVRIAVELHNLELTADIVAQIRQRVTDAWNGNDGESIRVQIGEEVFASRFYCPVRALTNDSIFFDIVNIKVRRQIGSSQTVNDNAFQMVDDFLTPQPIPAGEVNPFFEMDADNALNTKNVITEQEPPNSVFAYNSGDEMLVNKTNIADAGGTLWGEWGDSFESTLNEFPVLAAQNVFVVSEGGAEL